VPRLQLLYSPPEPVASPGDCAIALWDNGTDWGVRINAADVALGGTVGVICCNGGGNIATQIVLNSGASSLRTLRFGVGTWTNSVPQSGSGTETILPHDNVLIEGHGWDTILQEAPSSLALSYFLVRPFASHTDGAAQVNNVSMRNIQLSGVGIAKAPNGSQSTVNTGLLNGGTYQNIWFNKTHAIGLTIGESNVHNFATPCRNVVATQCKFTNVGGGTPPDYVGGGGVSLAVIDGDRITISNNTFIDAIGNTMLDLEPNSINDPITNITITGNSFSAELSTGNCLIYGYGIATHHGEGGPVGPITITNNVFRGTIGQDGGSAGQMFAGTFLYIPIYINYGGTNQITSSIDVENNDIKYCLNYPFIIDHANGNTIKNNTFYFTNADALIIGNNNVIQGNLVTGVDKQPAANNYGIVESGTSNFNSFIGNTVNKATVIVGANSTNTGEIIQARPTFTIPPFPLWTSGTVTTTNTNDLLIGVAAGWVAGAGVASAPIAVIQSPFTSLQRTNVSLPGFSSGYRIVSSTGTYSATWSTQQTEPWLAGILALKASAAPALVQQNDAGQATAISSFTVILSSPPTNGNCLVLTYCYVPTAHNLIDVSAVSGGGVTWVKGPDASTPWGIATAWYGLNAQSGGATITVTLSGTTSTTDATWANVSEWTNVLTASASDGQATNSFPTTW
jgi:hypothetical protein